MKIEVYGSGCDKYFELVGNIKKVIKKMSGSIVMEEITNPKYIAKKGFTNLPALVVAGNIILQGKLLSAEALQEILN